MSALSFPTFRVNGRLLTLDVKAIQAAPNEAARPVVFPPNLTYKGGGHLFKPAFFDAVRKQPFSWARNHLFYADELAQIKYLPTGNVRYPIARFEVRDYHGQVVLRRDVDWEPTQHGTPGQETAVLNLGTLAPGWYEIIGFDDTDRGWPQFNTTAHTTFAVMRRQPAGRFPERPPWVRDGNAPGGYSHLPAGVVNHDAFLQGITGGGPERFKFDPLKFALHEPEGHPDNYIKRLTSKNLAQDNLYYLPFGDNITRREPFGAFTYYTNTPHNARVAREVAAHLAGKVELFEGRNEPQGAPIQAFLASQRILRDSLKAGNPNAKFMGPGSVDLHPAHIRWMQEFFDAGGADLYDAFSFHAYNVVNGDLALARDRMGALETLLNRYPQLRNKPRWQTEQGYPAPLKGTYWPNHQGRWGMLHRLVMEQGGIPLARDPWWPGFGDFPNYAFNADGSPNPIVILHRVYSEESFGKRFERKIDFGQNDEDAFIGNLHVSTGDNTRLAVLMSAGDTEAVLRVRISAPPLAVRDLFGNDVATVAQGNLYAIPVFDPVYVQLPAGATFEPVIDARPDLLRGKMATITNASGLVTTSKITDGVMRAWPGTGAGSPINGPNAPFSIVLNGATSVVLPLDALESVDRLQVFSTPPHAPPTPPVGSSVAQCALLDWKLEYQNASGAWVLLEEFKENAKVRNGYMPFNDSAVVTNYAERWIWDVRFAPIEAQAFRLTVFDATSGGMPTTETASLTGGMATDGVKRVVLRQVRAFEAPSQ